MVTKRGLGRAARAGLAPVILWISGVPLGVPVAFAATAGQSITSAGQSITSAGQSTPSPTWLAQPQADVATEAATVPDIMGTVALHIRPNPTSTRWTKLMHASLAQPRLDDLIRDLRGLSPDEQVSRIQSLVAQDVRTGTGASCADDGYWAPAQETLARGTGDCFDVAIAKMEALRSLGVASTDLYLTTGRFRPTESAPVRETAALLVKLGSRFWLLPDWSSHPEEVDGARSAAGSDPGEFWPVITYGVGVSWVHGRRVSIAALMPSAADRPASMMPAGRSVR